MEVEKLILKFFFKCEEQKLVKAIMKKHKVEDLDHQGTGLLQTDMITETGDISTNADKLANGTEQII